MARRRLVTRLYLATLTGRTKQAITEAANRGSLREARAGHRLQKLDLDHPATVAYVKRCGAKIPAPAPPKPKPKKAAKKTARGRPKAKGSRRKAASKAPAPSPDPDEKPALPVGLEGVDAERFADMTLRQVAQDWGTWDQFIGVVDAVKKLATIREKDDKHAEFEGAVISRELVATHVFSYLEKLHRRFLGPVPKTVVRKAIAGAKAGVDGEELEAKARELMGAELAAARDSIARTLRKV